MRRSSSYSSGTSRSSDSRLPLRRTVRTAVDFAEARIYSEGRLGPRTGRPAAPVFRLYAYLAVAQLRAAEDAEAIRPHPPPSAAIAAASAVILTRFFPLAQPEIDAALAAQADAEPWPGATHQDFDAGA